MFCGLILNEYSDLMLSNIILKFLNNLWMQLCAAGLGLGSVLGALLIPNSFY